MNSFILAHPCFFSSFIYESSVYPSIQPHVSPSFLPSTHPPIHSSISSFLRAISNQLAQIHTTAKTMYAQQYLWFKQLQKMWAVFSCFSGLIFLDYQFEPRHESTLWSSGWEGCLVFEQSLTHGSLLTWSFMVWFIGVLLLPSELWPWLWPWPHSPVW